MLSALLNYTSPYFLRHGISLNLDLADLATLAGQQASEIFLSVPSGSIKSAGCHAWLSVGSWGLDTGPHACAVNTLLTELISLAK